MARARRDGIYLLLLGASVFLMLSISLATVSPAAMVDFKALNYSGKCLLQHRDPYNLADVKNVYREEQIGSSLATAQDGWNIPQFVYLPTLFTFTIPFALLPYSLSHLLWIALTAGTILVSAYLMWNIAAAYSPLVAGFLAGLLLANSELAVILGNPAGIAISLCVIAVWCFVTNRLVLVGIFCLSIGLIVKPHDAGLVWLYFMIAGKDFRKHAVRVLLLTALLSIPSILWVTHIAPEWMQELHTALSIASQHGGMNDPGPASSGGHGVGMLISLQTALSLIKDDPAFYNPVTYLILGALIALWIVATTRLRATAEKTWVALAAIAALSMLPVYHRQCDAMILFLTIPACAILWKRGGISARLALLISTAGIVLTGDLTWAIFLGVLPMLRIPPGGWTGQLQTALLLGPAPLSLLAVGAFYLWFYLQMARSETASEGTRRESLLQEPLPR